MSQTEVAFPNLFRNKYFIVLAVIVTAIAIGMAGSLGPLIPLGVVASLYLVVLLFKWPDINVILAAFILYTNIAVVMTKFHAVPVTVGYVLPLLLLIPLIWHLLVHKRKIKTNPVFILMVLYLLIIIVGSMFSRDIKLAMPNVINYLVEGLGIYFLFTNTIRTPKLLKQVVWSLLIAGALIGALSLFQQLTGTFDNNYGGFAQVVGVGFTTDVSIQGNSVQRRQSGPIGEKNRFAQIMLILVPLGLFQVWGVRSKKSRLVASILTGLILIGASLAFSRGAQIAFLLLIIIMTFMRYIKVRQLLIVFVGIILLLLAFPQNATRFTTLGGLFLSEEEGGIRSADGSIQGRATEMLAALYMFGDHPIIGVGPGMYRYYVEDYAKSIGLKNITTLRQPHSLYPGIAAENGILGLLVMMGVFLYTLYRLTIARVYWLERNQTDMANLCTGFFLAVISYMTTGIFLHMAYIRYMWLIIALSVIASEFSDADVPIEIGVARQELDKLEG